MASIEEVMRSVNKKSLFGKVSPDYIQTAKSERKEKERQMKEHLKQREAEQRKLLEEEERKEREDADWAAQEYHEYVMRSHGNWGRQNVTFQNERYVKHFMRTSGEGGIYSNKAQMEVWQPGSSNPRYTQFYNPNFSFRPVSENSEAASPDLPYAPVESPELSVEDFPQMNSEPTKPSPPKDTRETTHATVKPRRSRVAANFTNKIPENGVEEASSPRRPSWRDRPSVVSISDLNPRNRIIGQINNNTIIKQINRHLSSARDEFKLCNDDFPPIGKGRMN